MKRETARYAYRAGFGLAPITMVLLLILSQTKKAGGKLLLPGQPLIFILQTVLFIPKDEAALPATLLKCPGIWRR